MADGYNKGYGVITLIATANFIRPANTSNYSSGQLVAQSVTAATCAAMVFSSCARAPSGSFQVRRARVKKTGTGVSNASFRVHLYQSNPSISSGDGAVWSTSESGWLGRIDVTVDEAFLSNAKGAGAPSSNEINGSAFPGLDTMYGLIEARSSYTPVSAEVFTVELEIWQN